DELSGSWDHLPAETLALTVQSPPPYSYRYVFVGAAAGAGFLLSLLGGWTVGSRLGRHNRSAAWALLISVPLGAVWAVAMLVSFIIPPGTREAAGVQAAWTYGYGDPFIGAFAMIVTFPVGTVVTQLAAFVACRRRKRG
ncbi:MAG TPA: hypothetical protein VK993_01705, partial [Chthoniobacterales bacterium]|nr:hypothetical protein [Chthoniobacterales bacterium]